MPNKISRPVLASSLSRVEERTLPGRSSSFTMPNPSTATSDLPTRAPRAKDDFDLPMPRRSPLPAPAVRQLESRPHEDSLVRAQTEAKLLWPHRLLQLDQQFGKAEWARKLHETPTIKSWERIGSDPIVHPRRLIVPAEGGRTVDLTKMLNLERIKRGLAEYMFVVTPVGALVIGEELPAPGDAGGTLFLGHPTLTGGGQGRIAGELRYDREKGEFFINNSSGRYNADYPDRGPQQLENAAERFRAAGLPVSTRYRENS